MEKIVFIFVRLMSCPDWKALRKPVALMLQGK